MTSLAITYYIKAVDNYPYDLEQTLESLNYALSYDEEHAASHCLMGRFYFEQVVDFKMAFYEFELALIYDENYIETYYHYSNALIKYGNYKKAWDLLNIAKNLNGVSKPLIIQRKALIKEVEGNIKKAKKLIKKAISLSIDNEQVEFLTAELKRLNNKKK